MVDISFVCTVGLSMSDRSAFLYTSNTSLSHSFSSEVSYALDQKTCGSVLIFP
jgi:hypothetical protein